MGRRARVGAARVPARRAAPRSARVRHLGRLGSGSLQLASARWAEPHSARVGWPRHTGARALTRRGTAGSGLSARPGRSIPARRAAPRSARVRHLGRLGSGSLQLASARWAEPHSARVGWPRHTGARALTRRGTAGSGLSARPGRCIPRCASCRLYIMSSCSSCSHLVSAPVTARGGTRRGTACACAGIVGEVPARVPPWGAVARRVGVEKSEVEHGTARAGTRLSARHGTAL